jgi:hypothetical protein
MKPLYIKNAKIGYTYLGIGDYGYLSAIIGVEHDTGNTGFGTHDLRFPPYGINYIVKILETLEVDSWEELVGTHCRIKRFTDEGSMAIGHIIKDQWFHPEEIAKKYKEQRDMVETPDMVYHLGCGCDPRI